jgi:hypothetical protein
MSRSQYSLFTPKGGGTKYSILVTTQLPAYSSKFGLKFNASIVLGVITVSPISLMSLSLVHEWIFEHWLPLQGYLPLLLLPFFVHSPSPAANKEMPNTVVVV